MKKLFEFVEHIGDWRVLVQSKDIASDVILTRHITNGAVTTEKIADKAVTNPKIGDKAVNNRTLDDNAVEARNIKAGAVTPEKVSDNFMEVLFQPIVDRLMRKDEDLQHQIDSIQMHGFAVSNEFGDDPYIGVSQKAITAAFNKLWSKIEDITGEILQGISMIVTPEYFIGEDGCDVHINASTAEANGTFEHIAFYIDGELLAEAQNVEFFEYDTHIDDTSVIMCKAKIMGVEYQQQKVITHYNSFWLGAGTDYSDVMTVQNVIPITNGMRGAYDVNVQQGEHIIIVIGDSLKDGFIRADINSVEIPFVESTVTLENKTYRVFTSVNTYNAGTYNIDING